MERWRMGICGNWFKFIYLLGAMHMSMTHPSIYRHPLSISMVTRSSTVMLWLFTQFVCMILRTNEQFIMFFSSFFFFFAPIDNFCMHKQYVCEWVSMWAYHKRPSNKLLVEGTLILCDNKSNFSHKRSIYWEQSSTNNKGDKIEHQK